MSTDDDAIDLIGYALSDARQELTEEFTIDDVRKSVKAVLAELMIREPTDDDADAVLAFWRSNPTARRQRANQEIKPMSEAKHTPTPWHVTSGMSGDGYIASDAHGYVPLYSPYKEGAHKDDKHGGATPKARANADHIVHCVNAHDDLLEACSAVLAYVDDAGCEHLSPGNFDSIRQAIVKATPEPND